MPLCHHCRDADEPTMDIGETCDRCEWTRGYDRVPTSEGTLCHDYQQFRDACRELVDVMREDARPLIRWFIVAYVLLAVAGAVRIVLFL